MVKYCSLAQFQRPLMVKYGGMYIQTFGAQVAVLAWVGEDWSLCHVRRTFCSRQYQLSNIAFEFLCTKRTAEHSQSPKTVLFVITEILTLTLVPSADVAAVNRLSPVSLPCQPTIYSHPPPPPPPQIACCCSETHMAVRVAPQKLCFTGQHCTVQWQLQSRHLLHNQQ